MGVIDTYLGNNLTYSAGYTSGGLTAPPVMRTAIVACMDARLEVAKMLGLREGDAHVLRNAGGVVTEDIIRSLTISQCVLGTREVMIVQHTDCGMLTPESEMKNVIQRESGAWPSFALLGFADLEKSVQQSVAEIEASPYLPHKDAVRGFIFEVHTGRLIEVTKPDDRWGTTINEM